jgi:hypothetical protein
MSSDFKAILLKDPLMANASSEISFGVYKGGQTINSMTFPAQAKSSSSHNINIQVPSQESLIDPAVVWHQKCKITYTGVIPANTAGARVCYVAPHSFPAISSMSSMKCTLNNSTFNMDTQTIFNQLSRFHDRRELQKYNGGCPVQSDYYASLSGLDASVPNSPFAGYDKVSDIDILPRGAYPLEIDIQNSTPGVTLVGNVLTLPANNTANPVDLKVVLYLESYEPMPFSPFSYANHETKSGLYGITAMNFNFVVGDTKRIVGFDNDVFDPTSIGQKFTSVSVDWDSKSISEIILHMITGHASDMASLSPRNVHLLLQYPYITKTVNFGTTPGDFQTIVSDAMQVNQIPDYVVLTLEKANKGVTDAESYLPITGCNITFNSATGLLANYKPIDLWRASSENGVDQDYLQWTGSAAGSGAVVGSKYAGKNLNLAGSVLCLAFGKDIALTNDYEAPSVPIAANFQATLTTKGAVANTDYQLKIILIQSGVVAIERGVSYPLLGLLGKELVLNTSSQVPQSYGDYRRMVGGGWFDKMFSVIKKVAPVIAPLAKEALSKIDHPVANLATKGLEMAGYGRSGGMRRRLV